MKYGKYFAAGAVFCSLLVGVIFAQPSFATTTQQELMVNTGFNDSNLFSCVLDAYASANSTTVNAVLSSLGASDPLPDSGLALVKSVNCINQGINDTTGLSALRNLLDLDISENSGVSNIDLTDNSKIHYVNILGTSVETLDLSHAAPEIINDDGSVTATPTRFAIRATNVTVTLPTRAKKEGNVYTFEMPEISIRDSWPPFTYTLVESENYYLNATSDKIIIPEREDLEDGFELRYIESGHPGVERIIISANPTEVYYDIDLGDDSELIPIVGRVLAYVGEEWDSDELFEAVKAALISDGTKDAKVTKVEAFGNGSNQPNEGVGLSNESTETHVFGVIPEGLHVLALKYSVSLEEIPDSDEDEQGSDSDEDEELPVPDTGAPDTGFFTGGEFGVKIIIPIAVAISVVLLGVVAYGLKRILKRGRF